LLPAETTKAATPNNIDLVAIRKFTKTSLQNILGSLNRVLYHYMNSLTRPKILNQSLGCISVDFFWD